MLKRILLFILLAIATLNVLYAQEKPTDSIAIWIEELNDKSLLLEEKNNKLDLVISKIELLKNDSLYNNYMLEVAIDFRKNIDTLKFRKVINKCLINSKKRNDSAQIAMCYWQFGNMHYKIKNDSSFYYYNKAQKLYKILSEEEMMARVLMNMAIIKKNIRDYTDSEIITIKAIKVFKLLENNYKMYVCYNNLGIVNNNLKNYNKAIEYHNEALKYLQRIKKNHDKEAVSYNNIGVVYKNQKKYRSALKVYTKALIYDSLYYKTPKIYATLIANMAYAKMKLKDTIGILAMFNKSLHIRDSLNIPAGIAYNKIHLAEYFLMKNDTIKSIQYAKEANALAIKTQNYSEVLSSYNILAKSDPKNAAHYLEQYIAVNDTLIQQERATRNKFMRIEYETDELQQEFTQVQTEAQQAKQEVKEVNSVNKRMTQLFWWIFGALVFLGILGSTWYYKTSIKNKYEKVVLQQQLLRSQMDPHFLFNTLNVILHSTDTDAKKTKNYILKLSRLLRIALENSRKEFVPLEDEVHALNDYLNLQSDFSNKFDFNVILPEDLEAAYAYLPPMLIQPFVENAIIHGIMNTQKRGTIEVAFTEVQEDLMCCTITDNGIGHSNTMKKNQNSFKKHTSVSGDIVKERLAIYNKKNKSKASLQIEDIFDDVAQCIGTKVTLYLPYYEV